MRSFLFSVVMCLAFKPGQALSQGPATNKDLSVLGVFDGRTPCREIAILLDQKVREECIKIKWRLTLYQDSLTRQPAMYTLEGFIYRRGTPRKGSWQIVSGTKSNPDVIVYRLEAPGEEPLYLQKGDDNILFFLDKDRSLLVGNSDFSFTLNRIDKKVPL